MSIFFAFTGIVHLLISVWLPLLKFRGTPSENDREAIELFYKKIKALGIIEPKRYFFDSLVFYRRISRFDLNHFDMGYGLLAGASSLFSFSGLSFRVSRKILALVTRKIARQHSRSYIIYDFAETLHHYLAGNWHTIKPYDEDLVKENLDIGEVYFASLHLHWHGLHQLHQGNLETAGWLIEQLHDLADIYENDFTQLLKLLLKQRLSRRSPVFSSNLRSCVKSFS